MTIKKKKKSVNFNYQIYKQVQIYKYVKNKYRLHPYIKDETLKFNQF